MQTDLFDLMEGERLKEDGMSAAAYSKEELLAKARAIARSAAAAHPQRTCHADIVKQRMEEEGLPDLGNAAGSIFRGKEWRFTGRWIKSSRVSRHANENKLWYFIDG